MSESHEVRIAVHGDWKSTLETHGLLSVGSYLGSTQLGTRILQGEAKDGAFDAVAVPAGTQADIYEVDADILASMDRLADSGIATSEMPEHIHRVQYETEYGSVWVFTNDFTKKDAESSGAEPTVESSSHAVAIGASLKRSVCYQLFGMSATLGALLFVSYVSVIANRFTVITLFLLLWASFAVIAFWYSKRKRELFLVHVKDGTWIKRCFSGGYFMLAIRFVLAPLAALSLLVTLSQGMGKLIPVALVLGIGCLLLVNHKTRVVAQRQLKPLAATYYSARISFLLTAGLLAIGLSLASFWVPVSDLSSLSFYEVLLHGYSQAEGRDVLLRTVAGYWTMFDGARIWLAEQVGTSDASMVLKVIAWLIALLQGLIFVVPALLLIQSGGFAAEWAGTKATAGSQRKQSVRTFAVVGIIISVLFLWDQLLPMPWAWLTEKSMVFEMGGSTYQISPDEFDAVLSEQFRQMDPQRQKYFISIYNPVEERIDRMFDSASDNIPAYLDWRYSMLSEPQRLFFDTSGKMVETLFPEGGLKKEIEELNENIVNRYGDIQQNLESEFIAGMKRLLAPFKTHPHREKRNVATHLDLPAAYSAYLSATLGLDGASKRLKVAGAVGAASLLTPKAIAAAKSTAGTKVVDTVKDAGKTSGKASSTSTVGKVVKKITDPIKGVYRATKTWAGNNRIIGPSARYISSASRKVASKVGAMGIVKAGTKVLTSAGTKTVAMFGAERVLGTVAAGSACSVVPVIGTAVCGATAFVAITVGTEIASLKYDEYQNRDKLEQAITYRLNVIRKKIKGQYQQKLMGMLYTDLDQLRASVKAQVQPIDYL